MATEPFNARRVRDVKKKINLLAMPRAFLPALTAAGIVISRPRGL